MHLYLYEVPYEVYTRSAYMVCPGARHELAMSFGSEIAPLELAAEEEEQQQEEAAASSSKQQPAFAPLKEWSNLSFKNQRDTQIELFSGTRPPDTTFTSWYDLALALVDDPRSGMLNPMSVKHIY